MANILNVEQIENKLLKVKNGNDYHKKVYHINRTDNKTINSKMFKDIFEDFAKKYGAKNVMVRGLCNDGLFTFKGFNEENLNFENFHEYFANRVKDTMNFEYFYSVEITLRVADV
jgi:hypothetical protein